MRINKFLSAAGLYSRRQADKEIASGRVKINGKPAEPGDQVGPDDVVTVDGGRITIKDAPVLLAYYKPKGIVCTEDRKEPANLLDAIDYPIRVSYMGRLDKDSEGLLLLTNRGDWSQLAMKGAHAHEKEYEVEIDKEVTKELLQFLSNGVYLKELERTTRKCRVTKTGARAFRIILTQGMNRQIRRMCEAAGVRVRSLKRIRVLNIRLGQLAPGALREIEGAELEQFLREIGYGG